MTPQQARLLTGGHSFRLWQPYCYERLPVPDQRHVYLPLNRDYMPLGLSRYERATSRMNFRAQATLFRADPHTFDDVWWYQRDDTLWLYNDTPKSRLDYFQRLERLMSKPQMMLGCYEHQADQAVQLHIPFDWSPHLDGCDMD